MNTYSSLLTDRGLIERHGSRILVYAYPAMITVSGWPGTAPLTASCLMQLAERATQSVNQPYRDQLSLRLCRSSPALIMQSIFDPTFYRANLSISARIRISDQFPISDLVREKRSMLALASLIDLRGSTGTIRRTRVVTFSAWNTCSDADIQEPPPNSIVNRKTRGTFSVDWETLGDGTTPSTWWGTELMSELQPPSSADTMRTR